MKYFTLIMSLLLVCEGVFAAQKTSGVAEEGDRPQQQKLSTTHSTQSTDSEKLAEANQLLRDACVDIKHSFKEIVFDPSLKKYIANISEDVLGKEIQKIKKSIGIIMALYKKGNKGNTVHFAFNENDEKSPLTVYAAKE